jgi:hypothetical protein
MRRLGAERALTFCRVFMLERETKREPHLADGAESGPNGGVTVRLVAKRRRSVT